MGAEKENIKRWDYILLLTTLVLAGAGLVMVFSASSFLAEKKYGDVYFFFKPQFIYVLGGLAVMLVVRYIPYQFFCKLSYFWLLLAVIGLVLVFVPNIGHNVSGSSRWVKLGFMTAQPSEFAKLALVVFLAASLTAKREKIKTFAYGFFPHLIILSVLAGLIVFEPDLGGAVILAVIALIMFYVAGVRLVYLVSLVLAAVPAVAMFIFRHGYQGRRITAFLSPESDPYDTGYHILHSFYAFSLGGIFGVGPGASKQKLFYLPEPHTDFIFSVVGEEFGFVGVILVSLLFILLIWRGVSIALNAYELRGSYLALGLTTIIGLQAFLNMYVAVGLLPTKGLTLPFFSYGGSSLLMNFICVGMLLNIAAQEKSERARV